MKISTLVRVLEDIRRRSGDLEVVHQSHTHVWKVDRVQVRAGVDDDGLPAEQVLINP